MEEHILVGLSSAPSNAKIIRTAATMSTAFHGKFTALFVHTPDYDALSEKNKERLRTNTELAKNLGATIETVFGDDISYQIAEYARLSGVTKIVIGRSAITRKYLWCKPTLTEKLTAIAPNLDIHIIPDAGTEEKYHPKKTKKKWDMKTTVHDWSITIFILFLATILSYAFSKIGFSEASIIAIYLMATLLTSIVTSTRSSYVLSAIGSVLVFNFFFTSPHFSLWIYESSAKLTFLIIVISALIVGTLTDRLKCQANQAAQAAYRTNLLFETNRMLQKATSDEDIFQTAYTQLHKLFGKKVSVYAGETTATDQHYLYYPIRVGDHIYGNISLEGTKPPEAFEHSILMSIIGDCALALENNRNAQEKEEAKLQAENEKLRANLLRSISHDIRTPLTTISGNAAVLLSDSEVLTEETRKQMYSDIYEDSAWLHNLVENLLAVTRIEEGRMNLEKQPHLVEDIVSEALQHIGRNGNGHKISVHHNNELLLLTCDARLIIQTIINLVDNAIKYTPTGSDITIRTKEENGYAVLSVADNGPGIEKDEREKVFQMFYTGSNPIADSRRSLGLGLSLCKSIIDAHGGNITITDNKPSGTLFTITIPSEEVEIHE